MHCPLCGGKSTGKVGVEQFYCWDCCIEYRKHNDQFFLYEVSEDGSLMEMDPLEEAFS